MRVQPFKNCFTQILGPSPSCSSLSHPYPTILFLTDSLGPSLLSYQFTHILKIIFAIFHQAFLCGRRTFRLSFPLILWELEVPFHPLKKYDINYFLLIRIMKNLRRVKELGGKYKLCMIPLPGSDHCLLLPFFILLCVQMHVVICMFTSVHVCSSVYFFYLILYFYYTIKIH